MKTITETTATEVPDYKVIPQYDLLNAINAELAKIGEQSPDDGGLPSFSRRFGLTIHFGSPIRSVECSVSVQMPTADVTCADYDAGSRLHSVEVGISWSSTGRSVAKAAVALENYRRALGIATFIEALTQGKYIAVAK